LAGLTRKPIGRLQRQARQAIDGELWLV